MVHCNTCNDHNKYYSLDVYGSNHQVVKLIHLRYPFFTEPLGDSFILQTLRLVVLNFTNQGKPLRPTHSLYCTFNFKDYVDFSIKVLIRAMLPQHLLSIFYNNLRLLNKKNHL